MNDYLCSALQNTLHGILNSLQLPGKKFHNSNSLGVFSSSFSNNFLLVHRILNIGKKKLCRKLDCIPSQPWNGATQHSQLGWPAGEQPPCHCQVTSANSLPPGPCRTTQHEQFPARRTRCRHLDGEPGGQVSR